VRHVVVLGSTGSIGRNALDVIGRHPDKLKIIGLAAGSNYAELSRQAARFSPAFVTLSDNVASSQLKIDWPHTEIAILEDAGFANALESISALPEADIILNAISGFAGLRATAAALDAGKTVALANKESIVAAGPLLNKIAAEKGGEIISVDSEHSAIFQCLKAGSRSEILRLILTGSGGPFLRRDNLGGVTIAEALQHPTWQMGRKITIDSATMMNKGLEIIEASYLFGVGPEKIEVVIHPQSVIHSLVEFCDGSIIAQLSNPDMRLPIQYALFYPERISLDLERIDFASGFDLHFEPVDRGKFRGLDLAYRALREGGISPTVLNAANELAVQSFLEGKIKFTQIYDLIEMTMDDIGTGDAPQLDDIYRANMWASDLAEDLLFSL